MWTVTNFLICSFAVVIAQEVDLKADMPFLRVRLYDTAYLECCYTSVKPVNFFWVKHVQGDSRTKFPDMVNASDSVMIHKNDFCGTLNFISVQLNDSGLYQCFLNSSNVHVFTHGTYLQVYKPMEKTINLSESTKNKILTAEGVLLLLCVLLPSATLLFQSKKLNQLEKKRVKKEEENIYQGLNLDDCCTAYDQIERSQEPGPYEDVCNIKEEEEAIQLEKP